MPEWRRSRGDVEVPRLRYRRPVSCGHRYAVGVARHRRDPGADGDLEGGESPIGVLQFEVGKGAQAGSHVRQNPSPLSVVCQTIVVSESTLSSQTFGVDASVVDPFHGERREVRERDRSVLKPDRRSDAASGPGVPVAPVTNVRQLAPASSEYGRPVARNGCATPAKSLFAAVVSWILPVPRVPGPGPGDQLSLPPAVLSRLLIHPPPGKAVTTTVPPAMTPGATAIIATRLRTASIAAARTRGVRLVGDRDVRLVMPCLVGAADLSVVLRTVPNATRTFVRHAP